MARIKNTARGVNTKLPTASQRGANAAVAAIKKDPVRKARIRAEAEEKDRMSLLMKESGGRVLRSATRSK